jgi:hypothetical protein
LADSAGLYADNRGYFILRVGAISGLHFSLINPGITPAAARTNDVSRARINEKLDVSKLCGAIAGFGTRMPQTSQRTEKDVVVVAQEID